MPAVDYVFSGEDGDSLESVIKNRALPGVLVFDFDGRLEFINEDARRMLSIINAKSHVSDESALIPEEINNIFKAARAKESRGNIESHCPNGTFLCNGNRYAIRAVELYRAHTEESPARVMVIIDRCSMGRSLNVNLRGARERFGLTERELQVTEAIINGATNSDISRLLSISEHTVKDYVKRVIRKTGVKNRSSILCRIME